MLALAPNFSKGWAKLAIDAADAAVFAPPNKRASLETTGANAAQRAIQLDPKDGYAYLAQAQLEPPKAWAAREKLHEKSVSVRESDCGCEQEGYGQFLLNVGRPAEAERQWLSALDALPRSPSGNKGLIKTEFQKGDIVAADRVIADYKDFWNGAPGVKFVLFQQAVEHRRWADAAALTKTVIRLPEEAGPISDAFSALASGDHNRIAAARDALIKTPTGNDFSIILLAQLGAPEQALSALRQAYAAGDPNTSLLFDPLLAPLRAQPGWVDLLKQVGLIDYWRSSHKPPEFCKAADAPLLCKTL